MHFFSVANPALLVVWSTQFTLKLKTQTEDRRDSSSVTSAPGDHISDSWYWEDPEVTEVKDLIMILCSVQVIKRNSWLKTCGHFIPWPGYQRLNPDYRFFTHLLCPLRLTLSASVYCNHFNTHRVSHKPFEITEHLCNSYIYPPRMACLLWHVFCVDFSPGYNCVWQQWMFGLETKPFAMTPCVT